MPGSFSTVSPLSPVNGQTPILGPFGGNTRVSPPSTGSFSQPGTTAPISQPSAQYNPPQYSPPQYNPAQFSPMGSNTAAPMQNLASGQSPNFDAPTGFSNEPIGSGVQQATWTETNLRLSGMQVNDLTGAPNPPGYAPGDYSPNYNASSYNAPNQYPTPQLAPMPVQPNSYAPNPYPMQNFYPPATTPQPTYQPPTNWSAPASNTAPSTTFVPDPAFIATSQPKPLPPPSKSSAAPNGTVESPAADLSWRRPGTRF